MLRKKLGILFFLIAQAVMLGHGVISHHHHEEVTYEKHDHYNAEGEKHDTEDPFDLAFSNFWHAGEQVVFAQTDTKSVVQKYSSEYHDIVIYEVKLPVFNSNGKKIFRPDKFLFYQSPHYGANSLRGPPAFIVA